MAFTAKDVLRRASTILQDAGNNRWTLPELLDWINDCMREVTVQSPEAVAETVIMSLVSGTQQTLPNTAGSLLRVNCNVTGAGPYVRGKAVTPIARAILDAQMPGWHMTSVLPFNIDAAHVVEDEAVRRTFFIAPGNLGTGQLEIVVAQRPTAIALPSTPLNIDSYGATVDLDDMYLNAVLDFVLSKAFTKDINLPNGGNRAAAHYSAFQMAFGISQANEARVNPASADPARRA